jgi:hypothetical protein
LDLVWLHWVACGEGFTYPEGGWKPMGRDTLILLILIPATLVGQNSQLSEAAAKLLRKPRLGSAQITRPDGLREDETVELREYRAIKDRSRAVAWNDR